MVLAFVVRAASSICLQESSIKGTQYDLSLILIFCLGAACDNKCEYQSPFSNRTNRKQDTDFQKFGFLVCHLKSPKINRTDNSQSNVITVNYSSKEELHDLDIIQAINFHIEEVPPRNVLTMKMFLSRHSEEKVDANQAKINSYLINGILDQSPCAKGGEQ